MKCELSGTRLAVRVQRRETSFWEMFGVSGKLGEWAWRVGHVRLGEAGERHLRTNVMDTFKNSMDCWSSVAPRTHMDQVVFFL